MAQADLFGLPSRSEPFGIVLLEAGAAGLPVIGTRVGGIPELIEDGVTGILVAPDDVVALEGAMRGLFTDSTDANRLAQAWHTKVTTTWSWERTGREYLSALEKFNPSNGRASA